MNSLTRKIINDKNVIKFIQEYQTQCETINAINVLKYNKIQIKKQQQAINKKQQQAINSKKLSPLTLGLLNKDKYYLKTTKNNKKINILHSIYDQTFQQIKLNFNPKIQQHKIQKAKPYLKPLPKKQNQPINQQSKQIIKQNKPINQQPKQIIKQTKLINQQEKFKKIIFNDSFSDSQQQKTQQTVHYQNPQQKTLTIKQQQQKNQSFELDLQNSQNQNQNQKYIVFESLLEKRLQNLFIENILSKQISRQKYNENLRWILLTPVPNEIAFRFQVHIYKNLLKTEYQLYVQMQNSQDLRLIATAHNPNFNIDKTIFIIQQVNLLNQKLFIAQFQSDFTRKLYNLYGYNQNNTHSQQKLQQIQQILTVKLDKKIKIYIPLDKNKNIISYKKSINKSLQQIYNQSHQQKTNIQKLQSSNQKIDFYKNQTLKQFNKYQKTLFLQNQIADKLLFIGKIASKKYQLFVGKNISPLQAFGFIIAHLQNR